MLFLPRNYDAFEEHADCFGGEFGCHEATGGFFYGINGKILDLKDETEEKLLELIEQSKAEGKNLIYEAYKDKTFEYDPDCDY